MEAVLEWRMLCCAVSINRLDRWNIWRPVQGFVGQISALLVPLLEGLRAWKLRPRNYGAQTKNRFVGSETHTALHTASLLSPLSPKSGWRWKINLRRRRVCRVFKELSPACYSTSSRSSIRRACSQWKQQGNSRSNQGGTDILALPQILDDICWHLAQSQKYY